jgi:hypothetical protein
MAGVLHLLTAGDASLALETIGRQQQAGETVTVVLLPGAAVTAPANVRARRVPDELSWDALLDAIFDADHVIAW